MSEKFTTEAGEITPEMATAKSQANGRKSIFITVRLRLRRSAATQPAAAHLWRRVRL